MVRYLNAILLGAALLLPAAMKADDHPKRYYDRDRHDYHEWNEHEERAYRHYLQERRHDYHEWEKADRKQQKDYWKWRHHHPDYDDRR